MEKILILSPQRSLVEDATASALVERFFEEVDCVGTI